METAERRWTMRFGDSGWWFTLGAHLDPRHPMLTLFLSRLQVNIGRFYVVRDVDGVHLDGGPYFCWNDPEEQA